MWNLIGESGLSDDLQWVQVTALSNAECKLTYGNQVTGNTICVAGSFNEGSCYVRKVFSIEFR